ncbi:MT-A70 family methyltransferase [Oceanibacterium hippocampi]|uniref:DNA methyltransferase n=1 Tax=Oceanibacterium hippocampi TaxID=745714 RepID=A0A1Y5TZV3_9PROT|nr:MT-A70 family methyltransferase [Oceanibacterium hippocampi]SLN77559.1 hypothetical protein OCH7691_04458 [Oceanibacterium hippocampi]
MSAPLDPPLPEGQYRVILADPPWQFRSWSAKGEGRSAQAHYDTMPTAEIAALPVGDLAAADCALFLWATWPMLPDALAVIAAWRFTYKTLAFDWVKTLARHDGAAPLFLTERDFHMGGGLTATRSNTEPCLLATRGAPKRLDGGVRQLIIAPRREHSRKPDETRPLIERLYAGPWLDLFSRTDRPGWTCWGREAGKFNAETEDAA